MFERAGQVQIFDRTFTDAEIKALGALTSVGDWADLQYIEGAVGAVIARVDYDFSHGAYGNLPGDIFTVSSLVDHTDITAKSSDIFAQLLTTSADFFISTLIANWQNRGFGDSKTDINSGIGIAVYQPVGALTGGGLGNYIRIRLWSIPTE